jgi:hypothetical protein
LRAFLTAYWGTWEVSMPAMSGPVPELRLGSSLSKNTSQGMISIWILALSWESLKRLTSSSTAGRSGPVKPFQNFRVTGPDPLSSLLS